MSTDPFVEVRGDIPREHVDVMDAVVQATPGASRMSVLREIIAEWVGHEKHRAMLVTRVMQGNGITAELDRNAGGVGAELERNRTGNAPAGARRR
jgi:hypothetical protein